MRTSLFRRNRLYKWYERVSIGVFGVGGEGEEGAAGLLAPMPGKVIAIIAKAGDTVSKGDKLLVLEAMKMEHTICAPADGTVQAFYFEAGEQVTEGAELVDFEHA